ncbi:MAG: hypothetical protein KY468_10340 [Armatimonadetes bacterium]|nr:hypothetical protein [Armatimonadota bacterium]
MKAGQAVRIAKTWVKQEAQRRQGFRAAHLSGSLNELSEEDELPEGSDVDIYCVMDKDCGFPQTKFSYRGALIEAVSYPLSAYRSPEAVLSNPYLAHHFRTDCILADPEGLLDEIHRVVREIYTDRQWLQARYDQSKAALQGALEGADRAETLDTGFPTLFKAVRLMSNLILVAHLQAPTVRRSICRAKKILHETGHAVLAEDLLLVLGTADFSREQVLSRLSECESAFNRAVEVYRTPFTPGFNMIPSFRRSLVGGSEEMIQTGDHREAMLWIAAMYWTAHRTLQNDGPDEEKPRWQDSIDRLYAELGLHNLEDYFQRLEVAKTVAGKVMQLTDKVVYKDAS